MNDISTACQLNIINNASKGNVRIVQLRAGRPGPCLFLVPGTGDKTDGFRPLANLIDTPMLVFAIEARGVDDASEPDNNIEEMVDDYVERVRTIQESGPYFLLRRSFGEMIVFEMADHFVKQNENVS
jgi:thioesterase domain-containing protein